MNLDPHEVVNNRVVKTGLILALGVFATGVGYATAPVVAASTPSTEVKIVNPCPTNTFMDVKSAEQLTASANVDVSFPGPQGTEYDQGPGKTALYLVNNTCQVYGMVGPNLIGHTLEIVPAMLTTPSGDEQTVPFLDTDNQ